MFGDFFLWNTIRDHFPRQNNICGANFCHWVSFPAGRALPQYSYGMPHILGMRDILKIGIVIVSLIAVLMIDLKTVWTWTKKGCGYYLMGFKRISFAIFVKSNLFIATIIYLFSNFSNSTALAASTATSGSSFNFTKFRNKIISFPSDNWSPFYHSDSLWIPQRCYHG